MVEEDFEIPRPFFQGFQGLEAEKGKFSRFSRLPCPFSRFSRFSRSCIHPATTSEATSKSTSTPGYYLFSDEEVSVLEEQFADSQPSLEDVKSRFGDISGHMLSPEKLTPEKIHTRLKRMNKKQKRKQNKQTTNNKENRSDKENSDDNELLPPIFQPKRLKKYTKSGLEVVYTACWLPNKRSMSQIRDAVKDTILNKFSDQDVYSVLQGWKQKVK